MACSPTNETGKSASLRDYGSCESQGPPVGLPQAQSHPKEPTGARLWWPTFVQGSWRGHVAGVAMFIAALASLGWMLHTVQNPPSTVLPGTDNGNPDISFARDGLVWDSSSTPRPNIVFVMIDDMGFNDIGYQSTDMQEVTPTLDRLASEGVKLSTYYSMYICTPARAALMTGRYPIRYGLQYSVVRSMNPFGMPLTEKILPQYLKEAGYETHMVGKWHLGSYARPYLPSERGFDTHLGFLNDETDYWTHQSIGEDWNGRLFFDFGFGDKDGFVTAAEIAEQQGINYMGQYSTSVFANRAVDVIRQHDPQDTEHPLFLYLAHQAVHAPLGIPPEEEFSEAELEILSRAGTGKRQRFAKVLMYLDKSLDRVMGALRDTGHLENTIVIVASDNGGCPKNGGSNYPLRGLKHTYWEGGNRVPAFVWSASHLPAGSRGTTYSGMMHVTDWLPTLLGLSGSSSDLANPLDGVDQWAALTGQAQESPRTELLYNMDVYQMNGSFYTIDKYPPKGAVRVGKWKLIKNDWCEGYHSWNANDTIAETCQELGQCWRTACGPTCWNHPQVKAGDFLFNLEEDPTESVNLFHKLPKKALELQDRMTELSEGWVESLWVSADYNAVSVWVHHNDYMVPWYDNFDPSPQPDAPNAADSSA